MMQKLKLNTGYEIPVFGYGTWKGIQLMCAPYLQSVYQAHNSVTGINNKPLNPEEVYQTSLSARSDKDKLTDAVKIAIETGYRHIDCAYTEEEVGEGIKAKISDGTVTRQDIFVTSKLWNTFYQTDIVKKGFLESLQRLQLDYLDLLLMHWPVELEEGGPNIPKDEEGNVLFSDADHLDTYKAMENLVDEGLVRSIGISNVNSQQLQRILDNCRIKPAMVQVEIHPFFNQQRLIDFCKERGLPVTAHSPFGSPDRPWAEPGEKQLLSDREILKIAKKYNRTSSQVLLRYALQRGLVVLMKSVTPNWIKENFQVTGFELSDEDMSTLNSMESGIRAVHVSQKPMVNVGEDMALSQKENELRIVSEEAAIKYDYVRFTIVDFHGITRSKTVPKARFGQFFQEGISIYAGVIGLGLVGPMVPQEVQSIKKTNSGNVLMRPDPTSLHPLPLNGSGRANVGQVFCETYFPMTRELQESNPRTIARRQVAKLQDLGFELLSSWELEVTFVDATTLLPGFHGSPMAFTNIWFDEMEDVMIESEQVLHQMGIEIETMHTETAAGEYEFVTKPVTGCKQADNLILMKDVIRQVARKHGQKAIYMTKPFPGPVNSVQLHFNHSLKSQTNSHIFSDLNTEDLLSETCKHWLAGLLKHASSLSALCKPTVNCYRKLQTSVSPSQSNWGFDSRTACYRVKNYSPSSTYIECRQPTGSANPYLIMAATVAAGIDGLINKLECPPDMHSPGTGTEAPELPMTLPQAFDILKADSYICETLGQEFIDWFVTIKQNEIKHFEDLPDQENEEAMLMKERDCYMWF